MPPFPLALGLPSLPRSLPCGNASHPNSRAYLQHLIRCPAQFAVLARVYIEKLHEVRQMNFWKFWFGQKLGLEESITCPKIFPKFQLKGSQCPAQFAVLCHSSCSCLHVNTREKGKLCGALDEVRPIHAGVRVRSVTTRETGRDTSAQSAIWTPYSWNCGHMIAIIKP